MSLHCQTLLTPLLTYARTGVFQLRLPGLDVDLRDLHGMLHGVDKERVHRRDLVAQGIGAARSAEGGGRVGSECDGVTRRGEVGAGMS